VLVTVPDLLPKLEAQESATSPIVDLLRLSRTKMSDLQYAEADSIARLVLEQPSLRRTYRVQALQVLAAANFPEEEGQQRRDSAVAALQRLVRIAPESRLPRQISWPGLDSLALTVSRLTFGASTAVAEEQVLTGLNERANVDVMATRPADWVLSARPAAGGGAIPLDSASATTRATLHLRLFHGDKPLLPTGEYELIVAARDRETFDSLRIRHRMSVTVLPPDLVPVRESLDPAQLKPERTKPSRVKAIVAGVLTTTATIMAASLFRDEDISQTVSSDGRAVGIGIVLGAGVATGGWLLDAGVPIPANREANLKARAEFDRDREILIAENERRRNAVRSTVTFNPEPY
jgi:hypothetical protein